MIDIAPRCGPQPLEGGRIACPSGCRDVPREPIAVVDKADHLGEAARDASDAIVGGVVYAILSEGRSFQTGRAESIARTVLSGVSAR